METSGELKLSQLKKSEVLDQTVSYCTECFKIIPARIIEREGKVFMEKECCKKEIALIENDPDFYKKVRLPLVHERNFPTLSGYRHELIDKFNEEAHFLLMDITLKCDKSCPICYLKFIPLPAGAVKKCQPSINEIIELVKHHKSKVIQLIGGEPTVREDLPEIIEIIKKSGNTPHLVTNGLKLSDKNYVKELKRAGLDTVCFSFDGFNDAVYEIFRGEKQLQKKFKALKNLKDEGINVWLVSVIARGINDNEVPNIIKFASMENDFIKGVEFYPLVTNVFNEKTYTVSDILKIMEKTLGIETDLFVEQTLFHHYLVLAAGKLFGKKIQSKLSFLTPNIRLKVNKKKFVPLFSLNELRKFNNILKKVDNKNRLEFLIHLLKNASVFVNPQLFKLSLPVVLNNFHLVKAISKVNQQNVLRIYPTYLGIFCEDLKRRNISIGDEDLIVNRY